MFNWLSNRAKEPSTAAGVAAAGAALWPLVPPQYQSLIQASAMLFGAIAALKKDASSADHPDNRRF